MSAQCCAHFFVCGALAGRMMDPAVRARRLRRSPTEGSPLGVSVDSRQERRTHRFAPLWSNGTRADNSPKKRYRPFARNIPAAGFRLWCIHFFACGALAGRMRKGGGLSDAENGARGGVALQRLIFFLKLVDLISGI